MGNSEVGIDTRTWLSKYVPRIRGNVHRCQWVAIFLVRLR